MKKQLNYSFIIPHLNQPEHCINAVQSIINCGVFPLLEIIIVDAGSLSDNFFKLKRKSENITSRQCIKLIRSSRRLFPGGARNLGAVHASGNVLVFIDSDCKISSHEVSLERINQQLKHDQLIFGKTFLDCENRRFRKFFTRYFSNLWNEANALNFMMISRDFFFRSRGFDETLPGGEDILFISGKDTVINPGIVIEHSKELDFNNFSYLMFSYGKNSGSFYSRKGNTFSGKMNGLNPICCMLRLCTNIFLPFEPMCLFYKTFYYFGFLFGLILK